MLLLRVGKKKPQFFSLQGDNIKDLPTNGVVPKLEQFPPCLPVCPIQIYLYSGINDNVHKKD
jgi:hypothetical protein